MAQSTTSPTPAASSPTAPSFASAFDPSTGNDLLVTWSAEKAVYHVGEEVVLHFIYTNKSSKVLFKGFGPMVYMASLQVYDANGKLIQKNYVPPLLATSDFHGRHFNPNESLTVTGSLQDWGYKPGPGTYTIKADIGDSVKRLDPLPLTIVR